MRVHRLLPASMANGPGTRFVVWAQGCSRRCPGCFNPLTHDPGGGQEMAVSEIIRQIPHEGIDGITVSGGEPFEQAEELAALLEAAGQRGLDRLVYTGFTYEELGRKKDRAVKKCLSLTDLLIDGPYEQEKAHNNLWTGSGNQRILQLCHGEIAKYCVKSDFGIDGNIDGELVIDQTGNIMVTGMIDSNLFNEGQSPCSS